ncbi:DUF6634 family protein [Bosea sp. UC22_33]|uniref:DUF6634 family protein n=1 Tax=Bosea sp. UC22_33 TaxID=3350165 RepID=UPI0036715D77
MIYPHHDRRPVPELAPEIERLTRLVADLERIRSGHHPDEAELVGAPMLEHWSPAEHRTIALVGTVDGHPTIPNGRQVCTSDLWMIAPELSYARTLNRFYRLGARHHLSDRWNYR